MAYSDLPLEERFWSKVKKRGPNKCWEWQATINNMGYGMFQLNINGKNGKRLAHRVSFEIHNGPIPTGVCVLHACDNWHAKLASTVKP